MGVAGCVPSSWASCAQSEMFATPTKAFTVTTAPQATVVSGSAQVRVLAFDIQILESIVVELSQSCKPPSICFPQPEKVQLVCSVGWYTAAESPSRAVVNTSARVWTVQ